MSSMRHRSSTPPLARGWGTVTAGDAPERFELCSTAGRRTVDARPDFEMASKWARALKRIHHIELHEHPSDSGWTAWIHGTGHRTPTARRISVSTAVALGLRHVPLVLALDGTPAR